MFCFVVLIYREQSAMFHLFRCTLFLQIQRHVTYTGQMENERKKIPSNLNGAIRVKRSGLYPGTLLHQITAPQQSLCTGTRATTTEAGG